jgi:plastocyanin
MKRRTVIAISGAALLALTLAVVGQAASTTRLSVQADPHGKLRYKPKTLTAKAGTVTIVMTNPKSSGSKHGIAVQGKGINKKGKIVRAGKTATLTLQLKAGRYTFYCNFDDHRSLGMKGTLTVK